MKKSRICQKIFFEKFHFNKSPNVSKLLIQQDHVLIVYAQNVAYKKYKTYARAPLLFTVSLKIRKWWTRKCDTIF